MSAAAAFFKSSRQRDWYRAGGSKYRQIPDLIDRLPRGLRNRATEAWKCIMRLLARGELDPMNATNPAMCEDTGYGETFIKGGIRILKEPFELVETAEGDFERVELPPLIVVERKHGRRKIDPGIGLARAGEDPRPDAQPAPLCTPPPGKREDPETTTTRDGSSSSFAPLPGSGPDRTDGPELPPELVEAVDLLPGLSRERLLGFYRKDPELARRVADWLRACLRHPELTKRPHLPTWFDTAFFSWKAKLDRGELTLADIDAEIEAKRRRWPEKVDAAKVDAEKAAEKQAKAKAEADTEASEQARMDRLREAWGLLGEPEREDIRRAVDAANPDVRRRFPKLAEPLDLAELECRRAADPHRRE